MSCKTCPGTRSNGSSSNHAVDRTHNHPRKPSLKALRDRCLAQRQKLQGKRPACVTVGLWILKGVGPLASPNHVISYCCPSCCSLSPLARPCNSERNKQQQVATISHTPVAGSFFRSGSGRDKFDQVRFFENWPSSKAQLLTRSESIARPRKD